MGALTRWSNPEVVRWARERLGLSPKDVEIEARKLSSQLYAPISAEDLVKWETGRGDPELEHLETLAEVCRCPVGYFFLETVPQEGERPYSFRGLARDEQSLSSSTRVSLLRFHELAQWTVHLIRSLDLDWEVKSPRRRGSENAEALDRLIREERARLGWSPEVRSSLGGDPVQTFLWWRRAIEGSGVFCVELKLDPSEVRGASLWLENYPFILVNRQDAEAATGRLFTLLHEYGHLITADEGFVCDFRGQRQASPEPLTNRFAAGMLLLPNELRERLEELNLGQPRDRWSDKLLDEIRRPFAVSRDVVAIMLQELDLAPPDFYESKRQQWEGRRPWGRGKGRATRNEEKLREVGYSLSRLLARAEDHPSLPWMDVSHALGMKVEKVEEFLRWVRTQDEVTG